MNYIDIYVCKKLKQQINFVNSFFTISKTYFVTVIYYISGEKLI
jgi:hypothetical protein